MGEKHAYRMVHRNGCGETAFYYDHLPAKHAVISSESATLLDGSRPSKFDGIICGSCGAWMQLGDMEIAFIEAVK